MKACAEKLKLSVSTAWHRMAAALTSYRGEGYVDTIVKMAIAVVVGALILTILMTIVGSDENSGVMGAVKKALDELFSKSNA